MRTNTLSKEELTQKIEGLLQALHDADTRSNILSAITFRLRNCDPQSGSIEFSHTMNTACLNRLGAMHGGLVATLLDNAMAVATNATYADENTVFVTQDLFTQYFYPVYYTPELIIRVQILHAGKRSISVSAHLFSGETLCCAATGTFTRIPHPIAHAIDN